MQGVVEATREDVADRSGPSRTHKSEHSGEISDHKGDHEAECQEQHCDEDVTEAELCGSRLTIVVDILPDIEYTAARRVALKRVCEAHQQCNAESNSSG